MDLLLTILLLILGGAVLIAGGEILVRGASRMAVLFGFSPLVIGLTIVAACTSAPELAVSLLGAIGKDANPDIAVGNVVGSNICNILLILGVSALICPLCVSAKMIKREIPLMGILSILVWVIGVFFIGRGEDQEFYARFPRWAGFLFLAFLVLYNVFIVREARKESNEAIAEDCEANYAASAKKKNAGVEFLISSIFLLLGLGMLVGGSDLFVDSAKKIAQFCGVSDLIISLTILAVGTSLPELVVSVVAALRKCPDIAVGNIVGSNIFNLLGILGGTSAIAGGLTLSHQAFCFDIPIMIGVALLGGYFCVTDRKLVRWEGSVLLLVYAGYIAFLIMRP